MQKFTVIVDGGHQAQVSIQPDGKGGFTGSVVSTDYGTGEITEGAQDGPKLSGKVTLDGYTADFAAHITNTEIAGSLKYGWFFNKSFTGTLSA